MQQLLVTVSKFSYKPVVCKNDPQEVWDRLRDKSVTEKVHYNTCTKSFYISSIMSILMMIYHILSKTIFFLHFKLMEYYIPNMLLYPI